MRFFKRVLAVTAAILSAAFWGVAFAAAVPGSAQGIVASAGVKQGAYQSPTAVILRFTPDSPQAVLREPR